ncbi:MAG: molybdate ABC transporter substrate-binding protein [Propionibacteriaceae bacterium]|nr:molybdate ABC transporter substrate-binding protein [Propionibacteriaceae bacterium]
MRQFMKPFALTCGALMVVASLSACNSETEEQVLTVFAAASLNEVFVDIAEDFEAEHKGVTVKFSFGGSSDLVSQMESGAPAQVFASANEKQMERAIESEVVSGEDVLFASNTLTLVTPADNPAGITSLAEAAESSLVICAPQVPCGAATVKLAESAGLELKPVSEENSVTDVLGKVTSGQADAGLVYVTDAKRAGKDVSIVEIPESDSIVNFYPIAAVDASDKLAQDFVDFVLSTPSQDRLRDTGFGAPVE